MNSFINQINIKMEVYNETTTNGKGSLLAPTFEGKTTTESHLGSFLGDIPQETSHKRVLEETFKAFASFLIVIFSLVSIKREHN